VQKSKFVLVVDDDVDIRETVSGALEDEGYDVAMARNGQEALAYLKTEGARRPNLILLDLMMPIMSGAEFRAAQEADLSLRAIPVVLVSASTDANARAQSMRVAGVVPKPLSLDILIDTVERYADRPS
jgi:CheY-like chemotaxis protein